jgi:hypothetical protein
MSNITTLLTTRAAVMVYVRREDRYRILQRVVLQTSFLPGRQAFPGHAASISVARDRPRARISTHLINNVAATCL